MEYWDASTLVKLYLSENDSPYFRALFGGKRVLTSSIAEAEILCTAYRKECAGELDPGVGLAVHQSFQRARDNGRVVIVKFNDRVMAHAQDIIQLAFRPPRPAMVRALDAIHVASAVSARATAVVTTDTRLRGVAKLAGLKVLP